MNLPLQRGPGRVPLAESSAIQGRRNSCPWNAGFSGVCGELVFLAHTIECWRRLGECKGENPRKAFWKRARSLGISDVLVNSARVLGV
jgi:hypothetical protein